jgi:hypothetical protein
VSVCASVRAWRELPVRPDRSACACTVATRSCLYDTIINHFFQLGELGGKMYLQPLLRKAVRKHVTEESERYYRNELMAYFQWSLGHLDYFVSIHS